MELLIRDRLYIPTFLPKENNFKQFNLKKEILRKVAISDEEREEVGLKQIADENRIEWNVNKDTPLVVDFSNDELEYLKSACEQISDEQPPDDVWATIEKVYNAVVE